MHGGRYYAVPPFCSTLHLHNLCEDDSEKEVTVLPDDHHKAMMNQDKHLEIRIRVSMSGDFRFSHMSGILRECGEAERSEASTALNGRTRVRAKKIWQRALPKPECSSRCALQMGIHPDSHRSTYFFVPFLFIVIE